MDCRLAPVRSRGARGAIGGAGLAGQALIRDIESGYFTKLLLTPTRRLALIWGPMIAGAVILVMQVVLILVLGLFMGLDSASGVLVLVLVVGYAFLRGIAFAGYAVFIALSTRSSAATQSATLVFFPLIFLSTTFVPMDYIYFRPEVSTSVVIYPLVVGVLLCTIVGEGLRDRRGPKAAVCGQERG